MLQNVRRLIQRKLLRPTARNHTQRADGLLQQPIALDRFTRIHFTRKTEDRYTLAAAARCQGTECTISWQLLAGGSCHQRLEQSVVEATECALARTTHDLARRSRTAFAPLLAAWCHAPALIATGQASPVAFRDRVARG